MRLQPAQQQVGVGEIRLEVGARDLHVDRRRRAEIEDLADHVGWQKREGRPGKATRKFLAHGANVIRGRPMVFDELDLDVAVLRADHAGVVVGEIDAADRHADVVDQRGKFPWRDD